MQVYADNAATTKMSRTAIEAMLPYMDEIYGNPSSLHSVGQRAAEALQGARETVAQCLNCTPRGGQSGNPLRRPHRRAQRKKTHHIHRV